MQTILTATDLAGNSRSFYINIESERSAQTDAAETWVGTRGTITESTRQRLNDYVGAPVWSEPTVIKTWIVK